MKRKYYVLLMVCLILCSFLAAGCQKDQKSRIYNGQSSDVKTKQTKEDSGSGDVTTDSSDGSVYQTYDGQSHDEIETYLKKAKEDKNILVWIVPTISQALVSEQALTDFNQRLHALGTDVRLEICYLEESSYNAMLEKYTDEGYGDLCFTGLRYSNEDYLFLENMIKAGKYLNLNDRLKEKQWDKLKNVFTDYEWNSMKVKENEIYAFPNQNFFPRNSYIAFSKEVFQRKDLKAGHMKLEDVSKYITPALKRTCGDRTLVWNMNYFDILNALGIKDMDGYWISHKTGQAVPAFSDAGYEKIQKMLHQYDEEGILYHKGNYLQQGTKSIKRIIKDKKFGIAVVTQCALLDKLSDIAYLVPLDYYYDGDYSQATAVLANSAKSEQCLSLLYQLYTDKALGNLLCLGQKGEDYELKDGLAVDEDGEPKIASYLKNIFGILDCVYSNEKEYFGKDISKTKEKYFTDKRFHESVLNGVRLDYSRVHLEDLEERYEGDLMMWKKKNFKSILKKEKSYFETAEKKNVDELNNQISQRIK